MEVRCTSIDSWWNADGSPSIFYVFSKQRTHCLYDMIARRHGYRRVFSPAANSLYVRIARRQGYLRVLSYAANSLHVRISRRPGDLRVVSPAASSLYVRIAHRQCYRRVPGPGVGSLHFFRIARRHGISAIRWYRKVIWGPHAGIIDWWSMQYP